MEPVDASRLSAASPQSILSTGISADSAIDRITNSAVARDRLPLSSEVAGLTFPLPLRVSAPSAPVARTSTAVPIPLPRPAVEERPEGARREHIIQRLLEILPGATALLIISTFVWGMLFLPIWLAVMLIAFDIYWAWRSINTGIHVVRGHSILNRARKVDWRQRYNEAAARGEAYLRWEDVRHIVIIPSYKETAEKLTTTLETIANQSLGGQQLAVVLALEGAEEGAVDKALVLQERFAGRFMVFLPTFHPPDIEGEIRGKSSNENWAARIAKRKLVDEMGYDLDLLTVTSCDADTQFPPNYYACLTYKFATNPKRYRRFWQAPIFYYNNVWEVPAPLRLPNSLGGLNHLAKLTRKYCVRFPQSTYSLSLRMAHEVDYWDPDIISEDWHMFLKCFFHCGGTVDVEPIFLPVGNDGVRARTYFSTFWEHYQQARRHAWGASDIPYAIKMSFAHPEIRFRTRLRRTWSVFENHVLWSSQWFLITVPAVLMLFFGLHIGPEWIDVFGFHLGRWWFSHASAMILKPCMAPLAILVLFDGLMRPPRPSSFKLWLYPVQFGQWFLLAVITFLFTALPALEAQIRLILGKRLEYKCTEKA
jgi:Glycosyl transferase family group 2